MFLFLLIGLEGCSNPYTVVVSPGKTTRALRTAEKLKNVEVWYPDSTKTWRFGKVKEIPEGTWIFFEYPNK